MLVEFFEELVVLVWCCEYCDAFVVLCGCADHCRAADVDVFYGFFVCCVRALCDFFEWVEVDADEVYVLDVVGFAEVVVLRVVVFCEDSAVDLWVECFDSSVEAFWESGDALDECDGYAFLLECLSCSAC